MNHAKSLAALEDKDLAPALGTTPRFVRELYRPLIEALAVAEEPQTPENLAAALSTETNKVEVQKVKIYLAKIVKAYPKLIEQTAEFLPDAATMIGLVKETLKTDITSANLAEANLICSQLVDEIVVPRHRSYLQRELARYIHADKLDIPLAELVEFLREDYVEFVKAQGQGLMSRAGKLNEELIRQSLRSVGLIENRDFFVTGSKSEGDIVVYYNGRPKKNLAIEVKSYGARERLLRGLHDAPPPKIGVGFFNMASEFNDSRTTDFLKTGALAIYLPAPTLDDVDSAAKRRTNTHGSIFYRPLSQLGADLLAFTEKGEAAYR